jgi:hypothetical protein
MEQERFTTKTTKGEKYAGERVFDIFGNFWGFCGESSLPIRRLDAGRRTAVF